MSATENGLDLRAAKVSGDRVVMTYNDWYAYRPQSFPQEFYDDNPLMAEFRGDINSTSEVRSYLLQKVPEEEREEVNRKFQTLDELSRSARIVS